MVGKNKKEKIVKRWNGIKEKKGKSYWRKKGILPRIKVWKMRKRGEEKVWEKEMRRGKKEEEEWVEWEKREQKKIDFKTKQQHFYIHLISESFFLNGRTNLEFLLELFWDIKINDLLKYYPNICARQSSRWDTYTVDLHFSHTHTHTHTHTVV